MESLINRLMSGQMESWLIWLDNVLEISLQKSIGLFLMGQLTLCGFSR